MRTDSTNCNMNLIDISGVCAPADTTATISTSPYWKQMYLTEALMIPEVKPDVEQINSIVTSVSIIRKEVIVTPRTYDDTAATPVPQPNIEGKLLSGRKLIIEGQLCQQIEYTALEDSQPIHSVEFFVPFSSFIIVPYEVELTTQAGTTMVDTLNVSFDVNACIEDVTACLLDPRKILKQVTMLLSAVPTSALY